MNLNDCFTNNRTIDLNVVRQKLTEKLEIKWLANAASKDKLNVYNQIKSTFGAEKYLILNIDRYEKSLLSQLRYGILPLRVETGRFIGERHDERICTLCSSGNIEDQFHFLFHCNLYDAYREQLYIRARVVIDRWDDLSDCDKLSSLFSDLTRPLARYVKNIFILRRNTIYKR